MAIDPTDVKKLRDMTGAGMMDAKNALVETNGDFDQAIDLLRKKGMASAAKRAGRATENGLVESYVHGGRIGVLVEVNCETDFVARTDDFKTFAHDIAMQVAAANPQYLQPEDVPADVVDREKDIYRGELEGQNKPAEVMDKIIAGKLDKFYEAVCLSRQPFIKDGDKTIDDITKELIARVGENVVIRRMARLELGEAI